MNQIAREIHITGIVQGVGFRPFIYNLALENNLTGWVRNSASGVDISVTGDPEEVMAFIQQIPIHAPRLAQIDTIEVTEKSPQHQTGFKIVPSNNVMSDFMPVSPDVAICSDCQTELFSSADRRFRYPFINCTNCGPRFTIIADTPYDRPNTTMAAFTMCPDCRGEYEDPTDRRFHAQPVACPVCGPHVWIETPSGLITADQEAAIQSARQHLTDGKIVAIKGLGGFHLACDAGNTAAVAMLRSRKGRPAKPFALMSFDIASMRQFVEISSSAEQLLSSPQAPIVLLPKRSSDLSELVAPQQKNLGFMLAYTPLHLLLLEPAEGYPKALVMTSGNLTDEPILRENDAAIEGLSGIADAFLLHDRPIYRRVDDSVITLVEDQPYFLRRARGYAPNPIRLGQSAPQLLAVGPQMKNTFCLTRDRYAFLSHHIGDLDDWETFQDFQREIDHYQHLFRVKPEIIVHDLHPDYASTRYALLRAKADNLPVLGVQHHHAHLAAAMIENHLDPETMVGGLIFDGSGYGPDGTIWGGEALAGNCDSYQRKYHLKTVPLPGGDASIRKPARMALSTLWAYGLDWPQSNPAYLALSQQEREILQFQLNAQINTPQTSSMGRLFDAVAALLGVRESISYEAQAAIELEAIADPHEKEYYPCVLDGSAIDVAPILSGILKDLDDRLSIAAIAGRFHQTIAHLALDLAIRLHRELHLSRFVLSGGVWQNQLLLKQTMFLLENEGFIPLIHRQTPPNDGCVAFGQAMIASYRYQKQKE